MFEYVQVTFYSCAHVAMRNDRLEVDRRPIILYNNMYYSQAVERACQLIVGILKPLCPQIYVYIDPNNPFLKVTGYVSHVLRHLEGYKMGAQ